MKTTNGKNSSHTALKVVGRELIDKPNLQKLEDDIEALLDSMQQSWIVIAESLRIIRDERLYKAKAKTFALYLESKKWGYLGKAIGKRRANQIIEAGIVTKKIGHLTSQKVDTIKIGERLAESEKEVGLDETVKKFDKVAKDAGGDSKKISKALTVPKPRTIATRPEKQCIESHDGMEPLLKAKKVIKKVLARLKENADKNASPAMRKYYNEFVKELEKVADWLVEVEFHLPGETMEIEAEQPSEAPKHWRSRRYSVVIRADHNADQAKCKKLGLRKHEHGWPGEFGQVGDSEGRPKIAEFLKQLSEALAGFKGSMSLVIKD
jgi:hypothetical protein